MTEKEGIYIRQVTLRLGGNLVLDEAQLSVQSGETVGIIGANGCGKTSLLRIMAGLIYPSKGEVYIHGEIVKPGFVGKLPSFIGMMIENPSFLPHYSGYQNLNMLACIRGEIDKKQVMDSIRKVGLDPDNRRPVRTYSLGMRQRLGIAQAVMENPKVLLLDEPTNALDESGVQLFSDLLEEQVKKGTAVVLVSHHKDDIERYCDAVYRLEEGKLSLIKAG